MVYRVSTRTEIDYKEKYKEDTITKVGLEEKLVYCIAWYVTVQRLIREVFYESLRCSIWGPIDQLYAIHQSRVLSGSSRSTHESGWLQRP